MKISRWLLSAIVCWSISLTLWVNYSWGGLMDVRSRNNCVSESIINAEEWQSRYGHAVIAISNIRQGVDHAQALGRDSIGDYKWLTRHHSDGILRRWDRHFDVEPYRYVEIEDFIKEQEGIE